MGASGRSVPARLLRKYSFAFHLPFALPLARHLYHLSRKVSTSVVTAQCKVLPLLSSVPHDQAVSGPETAYQRGGASFPLSWESHYTISPRFDNRRTYVAAYF